MDTILILLCLFFVINITMFMVMLYNINNLSTIVNQIQLDENGILTVNDLKVINSTTLNKLNVSNSATLNKLDVSNSTTLNKLDVSGIIYTKGLEINGMPSGVTDQDFEKDTFYTIRFGTAGTTRSEGDRVKDDRNDQANNKRSCYRQNGVIELRCF